MLRLSTSVTIVRHLFVSTLSRRHETKTRQLSILHIRAYLCVLCITNVKLMHVLVLMPHSKPLLRLMFLSSEVTVSRTSEVARSV